MLAELPSHHKIGATAPLEKPRLYRRLFRRGLLALRTVRTAGVALLLLALPPWLAYFFCL